MRDELFDELVAGIKEAGAYLRGEKTPLQTSELNPAFGRECTAERAEHHHDPADDVAL